MRTMKGTDNWTDGWTDYKGIIVHGRKYNRYDKKLYVYYIYFAK